MGTESLLKATIQHISFRNVKKHIISVTIAGLFMLLAIYFATLYLTDQREVSRFLDKVTESPGFYGEALSDYSYLIQIRDNVVAKISLDKTKLGRRKPWGYRVSTIIRKQSGQCGEVTRLLINLLHRLHIPSRRVTLLGKDFMHAVIEANVGGRWVLIDTTNSPMHFKEIVTHNPRSILEYFLKPLGKKIYTFSVVEEFQQLEITYFTYFYNLNSILHLLRIPGKTATESG